MIKRGWARTRRGMGVGWMGLLAAGVSSCGEDMRLGEGRLESTGADSERVALALEATTSGTPELRLDFTPPGSVYMTSFTATFQVQGEYPHTAYFYQPSTSQAVVRFTLRSEIAGTSTRDPASVFSNIRLVRDPDQASPTEEGVTAVADGIHFDAVTRGRGWYALKFEYRPTANNRVLTYEALDAQAKPMKTAWVAPSGKSCKLRAAFSVSTSQTVYLKGAAFNAMAAKQSAFVDNIKVDDRLLYRKGFEQGLFNFPVGYLSARSHSVELDFSAWSGEASRSWFGVSPISFDPRQREGSGSFKTRWDAVQFLYGGRMRTGDYDAWSEGVAFAQSSGSVGSGDASFPKLGVRPPPVRRGTTFGMALEHAGLAGTGSNATIEISLADTGALVTWQRSIGSGLDYAGGVFTSSGFSSRQREHWNVSVPMDAAVGRYVLRAYTPNRTKIGSDVLFYVIHNPHAYVGLDGLSQAEVATYGYDEDEDGLGWNLASTQGEGDLDDRRDNFVVVVDPPAMDENGVYIPAESYSGTAVHTGAFRRSAARSAWDHSLLDYAMASAQGTTTEFETMIRLLRFVNQRSSYENSWMSDDAEAGLAGWATEDPERTLAIASACSQPGNESAECVHGEAVCYTFASRLAAIARSTGLLSRAINSGTHAVTEAYMPTPPNGTFPDADRWFVFDATDHQSTPGGYFVDPYDLSNQPDALFKNYWEAAGPRGQYCQTEKLIAMADGWTDRCNWITTSVDWVAPEGPGGWAGSATSGKILTAEYDAGAEYWIPASGVTGWLAFGDKDVYRINKASVNANYIRVRALPSKGGTNLEPELCILNPPIELSAAQLKRRCTDAANVRRIPEGDSYVIVFNDSNNLARFHGDVTQYRIEVGSGAGWERCDDGIRNGQEVSVDCGGNCPGCNVGQPCNLATDCQSMVCKYSTGRCVPPCNVDTAIDMGVPGQQTIVPTDGCVKVHAGYPSWWGSRTMDLLNGGGARYPIPFVLENACPDGGFTSGGTITTDWQHTQVGPITSPCPTVFDLRGDGSSNVILYYYGL